MKILKAVLKGCLVILALPWLYAVACMVFSVNVMATYSNYCGWVAGVMRGLK